MGMPLDHIIAKVGWVKASTFIKYYMKPIRSNQQAEVNSDKVVKPKKSKDNHCFKDPHDYADFWAQDTPKINACKGAAEKVSTFKNMHVTGSSRQDQVYGPTPFTLMSPASTIGYSYEDNVPNEQQVSAVDNHSNDPFDFNSELALIQDCELTDERTRSLAESLKETQLELVARGLSPPVAFSDRASLPGGTSSPLGFDQLSNLDISSEELSLSSSIHEAYKTLTHSSAVSDDGPLVDNISNVPLSPGNTLVTLEMHVGDEVSSENTTTPSPVEQIVMSKPLAEIVYGEATFTDNLVKIPDSLRDSVTVIPQDQLTSGADISLSQVETVEHVAKVAQATPSPKISYDSAIAALKAAGTDAPLASL